MRKFCVHGGFRYPVAENEWWSVSAWLICWSIYWNWRINNL